MPLVHEPAPALTTPDTDTLPLEPPTAQGANMVPHDAAVQRAEDAHLAAIAAYATARQAIRDLLTRYQGAVLQADVGAMLACRQQVPQREAEEIAAHLGALAAERGVVAAKMAVVAAEIARLQPAYEEAGAALVALQARQGDRTPHPTGAALRDAKTTLEHVEGPLRAHRQTLGHLRNACQELERQHERAVAVAVGRFTHDA